jgi:hypothetical protein
VEGEEISIDELFEELSNGKPFVTVAGIMKWDYLSDMIAEGDIDKETIQELFEEVGAENGKIDVDQLDEFVDLLADELGLVDSSQDTSDDDDEDEDEEEIEELEGLDDLDESMDDSQFYLMKDEEEITPVNTIKQQQQQSDVEYEGISSMESTSVSEKKLLSELGLKEQEVNGVTLNEHYIRKSKNNDLLSYVFGSVTKGKDHVVLSDVLEWDFTQALLQQGSITEASMIELFNKCNPKKGKLSLVAFEQLVDYMGQIDVTPVKSNRIPTSSNNVIRNVDDVEDDVDDFDDDFDFDESIQDIFDDKQVQ